MYIDIQTTGAVEGLRPDMFISLLSADRAGHQDRMEAKMYGLGGPN